jgi:hypothetical protein
MKIYKIENTDNKNVPFRRLKHDTNLDSGEKLKLLFQDLKTQLI